MRRFPKAQLLAGLPKSLQARIEAEVSVDERGEVACAVIHWVSDLHGLGLEKQSCKRIFMLNGPTRLVVDVPY